MKFFTIIAMFILKNCYCHRLLDLPPVFLFDIDGIWNDTETTSNPFKEIKSADFSKTLQEGIKSFDMVIIFVENELSVEDLSIKDKKGTPYANLRQRILQGNAKYLPAVKSPYQTVASILPPKYQNTFYLKNSNTPLNLPEGVKYLYIMFEDEEKEPRTSALRRHDDIIENVYFSIRQFSSVLALYTGKVNPAVVPHIDMAKYRKSETNPGFLIESKACLLSFHGFKVAGETRRHSSGHNPTVTGETMVKEKLLTKISYMDFELQFNFRFRSGDWILDSVGLSEAGEEIGRTEMGVGAPLGCSYTCADPLVIVNSRDGSDVTIMNYKIQPFLKKKTRREGGGDDPSAGAGETTTGAGETTTGAGETTTGAGETTTGEPPAGGTTAGAGDPPAGPTPDSGKTFGPSVDCGPYFTAPIISGLAVAFTCLAVLFTFITMMMNCHTNDRYDSVNNKPLVVTSEG